MGEAKVERPDHLDCGGDVAPGCVYLDVEHTSCMASSGQLALVMAGLRAHACSVRFVHPHRGHTISLADCINVRGGAPVRWFVIPTLSFARKCTAQHLLAHINSLAVLAPRQPALSRIPATNGDRVRVVHKLQHHISSAVQFVVP